MKHFLNYLKGYLLVFAINGWVQNVFQDFVISLRPPHDRYLMTAPLLNFILFTAFANDFWNGDYCINLRFIVDNRKYLY